MELSPIPARWGSPVFATVPIVVSAGACAMCAATADWYSFSLILLGIIANGVSCYLIGSIKLKFARPQLAGESLEATLPGCAPRPGHVSGILITPNDIMLLKGPEDAAMAVALGKFVFSSPSSTRSSYRSIGACSILLLIQFIAQLLLIPQGTLFGQIMFVASLGVSWCYNLLLCSLDKSGIQRQILFETILKVKASDVKRCRLDSWPAMVAFVLLTLVLEDADVSERELNAVFGVLVEDTTAVWGVWKRVVLERLIELKKSSSPVPAKAICRLKDFADEDVSELSAADGLKLDALLDEAQSGIDKYYTKLEHH